MKQNAAKKDVSLDILHHTHQAVSCISGQDRKPCSKAKSSSRNHLGGFFLGFNQPIAGGQDCVLFSFPGGCQVFP